MSETALLKASLALPILCPLLASWLVWGTSLLKGMPDSVRNGVALFGLSLFPLVSLPYLAFALVAVALLRRRSVRAHVAFVVAAPVLFAALLALGMLALEALADRSTRAAGVQVELSEYPFAIGYFAVAVSLGYAYVGVVLAARVLVKRSRVSAP